MGFWDKTVSAQFAVQLAQAQTFPNSRLDKFVYLNHIILLPTVNLERQVHLFKMLWLADQKIRRQNSALQEYKPRWA